MGLGSWGACSIGLRGETSAFEASGVGRPRIAGTLNLKETTGGEFREYKASIRRLEGI